jgi:Icc-related predicted phosphoesterase
MVKIAAFGDLHCSKSSQGAFQAAFGAASESAEILLLAGDLTNYGLPEEARVLARELSAVHIPVLAVLGNHDFESGRTDEVRQILTEGGTTMLDGDSCEMHGIGIAGVKGFCGGFAQRALGAWGEVTIKQFVHEAVNEALKLETALARLHNMPVVALLHYSPIQQTVEGEPLEIYPFLGSSRLEEPINTYRPALVIHSHAHHGSPEGATSAGVPVYNVSMPLLTRSFADRLPFRVFEIAVSETPADPVPAGRMPAPPLVPVPPVTLPAVHADAAERRAGDRRH